MFLRKHKRNHPRMGSDPHFGRGKMGGSARSPDTHPHILPLGSLLIGSLPIVNMSTTPHSGTCIDTLTHTYLCLYTHTLPPFQPVCDHPVLVKSDGQIPSVPSSGSDVTPHSLHLVQCSVQVGEMIVGHTMQHNQFTNKSTMS